ncbi:MAG: ABC transporter substrate-binding protein, partial [Desulfovibrio sp.]|nr:ABC transporter substrate-binding protein [Desulfovibrio sp.]
VIFKVHNAGLGTDPEELQAKTGIPVVVVEYGNLGANRAAFYATLRLMGEVLGLQPRAEAVVAFFETRIADLQARVKDVPDAARPSVFVGGIASRGPHGFQSTEPEYPPFAFVQARNLAAGEKGSQGAQGAGGVVEVAKEQIVAWNPDVLFLDLSTLQLGDAAGGLHELKTDPAYQTLTAVQQGRVYGVLPYNWYNQNFGSILANAYFIGSLLYPDRFADVDPAEEADAIYTFLVDKPVFADMNALFGNRAFIPIPLR